MTADFVTGRRAAMAMRAASREPGRHDAQGVMLDLVEGADVLIVSCSGIVPKDHIIYVMENTSREIATHRLFICDKNSLWYYAGIDGLTSSFADTVELVGDLVRSIGCKNTYAIGTSSGGYMALALAALLRLDRGLAFSPQTVLDPSWRVEHGDHRWRASMDEINAITRPHDIRRLIGDAQHTEFHVVYPDGDRLDIAHAERLRGLASVTLYRLENSQHNTSAELRRRGQLRPFIEAFMGSRDWAAEELRRLIT